MESDGHALTTPDGFSLGTLPIRAADDFVSLSRRIRAAGQEFGLQTRDVRRLTAATYEVGRLLVSNPGVEAEIRLGEGPALQIVFRVPLDETERGALPSRIAPALTALRPLVHQLETSETAEGCSVYLLARFPTGATERFQSLSPDTATTATGDVRTSLVERPKRQALIRQANHDFQAELQETNSGVIAVYAELDDQADKLRQAEERLGLLLDSVHDYAICMLSPSGEVTSWNAGAERLFAYAAEEIIGRNFACFYTPADRDLDIPAEHLRDAQAHGRHEGECTRVRRGGSGFDAHVVLAPLRRMGELHGFSLVVRDVTERKRLEDDLRRRAEDLAAANRAKEDFLATLSHELRTPLNAMLGWTRLLRMGKLDAAAVQRALETIERNAHVQEQLIADILDVSRIVTGNLRLELRPIELAPVVAVALDAVRPAAEAKGIRLVGDTEFSGTVLGDPDRLQQVVWNLLANAIKFTPTTGEVSVDVNRVGPNAVITVSDSGEGIAPELLPFVFDRFRQGDGSVTRPHGGLGLGLSIVRHIVELHGGKVQALSAGQSRGSSFSVYLPVRAIQHAAARAVDQPQPLSGVKVLVVDDDADARDVVSCALGQCGAKTAAVGSAREALQMLTQFVPDVVVSDIGMPGEDGYSLIRRIRAISATVGNVPAIALTAYAQPDDARRALTAGFQKFVSKPVEVDELAAAIRTLANRQ